MSNRLQTGGCNAANFSGEVEKNLRVKRWFLILCVLALAVLSQGCAVGTTAEEPTPTPLPTAVIPSKPVYTVQYGDIARKLSITGRIGPVVSTQLYFKTGGRVEEVLVKSGDPVKAGQLLARLEGQARPSDLRRAEINLEQARYRLQLAEIQTPKSSPEYEIVINMRSLDVELAQLALDDLKQGIADTQILSPIDGTVLSVFAVEDTLAEPYRPVIELADLTQLEVRAEPTTDQYQLLNEGLPVVIMPVSGSGSAMEGAIRRLPYPYGGASAASTGEKEDGSARISMSQPPNSIGLEMGSVVRVEIIIENRTGVLWVPPQAIRKFQGRDFVLVQDGEGQRRVDVKLGIMGEDRVEILDGLSEGQTVMAP
jgi:membrane fusion protein, macrolide-specific efflux system